MFNLTRNNIICFEDNRFKNHLTWIFNIEKIQILTLIDRFNASRIDTEVVYTPKGHTRPWKL